MAELFDLDSYRQQPTAPRPLESGGGPGDFDGMEPRIARLEAHMEHVLADVGSLKADVARIKVDVATLAERVAHLPSKGFIVTAVLGSSAVVAALTAFGPALRKLLGLP